MLCVYEQRKKDNSVPPTECFFLAPAGPGRPFCLEVILEDGKTDGRTDRQHLL